MGVQCVGYPLLWIDISEVENERMQKCGNNESGEKKRYKRIEERKTEIASNKLRPKRKVRPSDQNKEITKPKVGWVSV